MKRGKSEEPFLQQDENGEASGNGGLSDSADDLDAGGRDKRHQRCGKDSEGGGGNTEEEMSVYNRIMERRSEWNNRRRNTDDCQVS